jgi:signal peptidase II
MPPLAYGGLGLVFVVCLDQASKTLLLRRLRPTREIRIGAAVQLRRVINVDWALGPHATGTGLVLLWGLAVSSALLLWTLDGSIGRTACVGIGVALGGATGNLLDRFVRGGVVDFIDIHFWPVFNLADAGIVAGLGLALLTLLV